LKHAPVCVDGKQALSIGAGFRKQCQTSNYSIWACAILPEHTHLVIARHSYIVEQMVNLLKGAATSRLIADNRHPFATHRKSDGSLPRIWAENQWKVYLDSEQQIETAIRYVEENPDREGKRRQHWNFVTPFRGLEPGHITYH